MVTSGELYLLAVTAMALVALGAAALVLRNIVRDGRERWRTGSPAPTDEGGSADDDGPEDGRRCPHCGEMNDDGYAYCQQCAERL